MTPSTRSDAPRERGREHAAGDGDQIAGRRRRGLSLKIKFFLIITALVAAVGTIWGFFAIRATKAALEGRIRDEGVLLVRALAKPALEMIELYLLRQERGHRGSLPAEATAGFEQMLELSGPEEPSDLLGVEVAYAPGGTDMMLVKVATLASPRGIPRIEGIGLARTEKVGATEYSWGCVAVLEGGKKQSARYFKHPLYREGSGRPNGFVILVLSAKRIEWAINRIIGTVALWGVLCLALGMVVAYALAKMVARPVRILVRDMDIVARGDLDHETRPRSSDEIGLLAHTFNRMTRSLRRARELEREAERVEAELAMAREIQATLLPKQIPRLKGIELHAFYRSAYEVGGDYYDLFMTDPSHMALIVADVSGKGVPASLVMSVMRTAVRLIAPGKTSAAAILRRTNAAVARELRRGMFITAALAILDLRTRELVCASAGHNPVYVRRAAGDGIEEIKPRGVALGFDIEVDNASLFDKTLAEQVVPVGPGDIVLAYTDGVVEAMDRDREEFSAKRLRRFMREHDGGARSLVEALVAELDRHQGDAAQHDDITIVALRAAPA